MSTCTVFGSTKVTVSESFIENMPDSVSKEEYFKEFFKDVKYTVKHDGKHLSCCLEGSWQKLISLEHTLRTSMEEWVSSSMKDMNLAEMCCHSSDSLKIPTIKDTQELLSDNKALECEGKQNYLMNKTDVPSSETVPPAENEVYMDIQLEHNYNHSKSDSRSDIGNPMVENEIYMDIKLSKTNNDSFTNPDLPVMLVVAKEDELGIEVLQLNVNKANEQTLHSKETVTSEDLKLRRKKYEENAPYKYFCNQCSFKTKRSSHMRNHSRFHERICTIYSCDQCDFSTIRASHLQRHVGTHKPEVFACSECAYSTHSKTLFNRHQRCKHRAKVSNDPKPTDTYQCLQCDYMTTSEKVFNRHLTVHLKRKQGTMKQSCFKCKQCSYQTPSRSNFYRHLGGVHGDERPYMCTTCGLCFKRSDTLAQHQTTHLKNEESGKSAFQCTKCGKFYRSANALEEHGLTHEEERRYLCELCGSAFKTRAVQRKHFIETHLQAKAHPCSTCTKTFSTKYLLKRHMKVHSHVQKYSDAQVCSTSQELMATVSSSTDWGNPVVPVQQSSNDFQVIAVHQKSTQQELITQDGSLFQVSPSLVASQSLPTSVVPVEYVISEANLEGDHGTNGEVTVTEAQITQCEGNLITLAFVEEG